VLQRDLAGDLKEGADNREYGSLGSGATTQITEAASGSRATARGCPLRQPRRYSK